MNSWKVYSNQADQIKLQLLHVTRDENQVRPSNNNKKVREEKGERSRSKTKRKKRKKKRKRWNRGIGKG